MNLLKSVCFTHTYHIFNSRGCRVVVVDSCVPFKYVQLCICIQHHITSKLTESVTCKPRVYMYMLRYGDHGKSFFLIIDLFLYITLITHDMYIRWEESSRQETV